MKIEQADVNRREIYRYLGYRGQEPDEMVQSMIDEVLKELLRVVRPAHSYRYYGCEVIENKVYLLKDERMEMELADGESEHTGVHNADELIQEILSQKLADNLAQCEEVILLAATLGLEADKLIQRYTVMNMAKASVAQACGAACIEAYCNKVQEDIRQEALERGLYLRPRFSPGYGDLRLDYQKDIFGLLECNKRLGMSLTDSMLMLPTKSVTAIIGLTRNKENCHIAKCSVCSKTDCEFRTID